MPSGLPGERCRIQSGPAVILRIILTGRTFPHEESQLAEITVISTTLQEKD